MLVQQIRLTTATWLWNSNHLPKSSLMRRLQTQVSSPLIRSLNHLPRWRTSSLILLICSITRQMRKALMAAQPSIPRSQSQQLVAWIRPPSSRWRRKLIWFRTQTQLRPLVNGHWDWRSRGNMASYRTLHISRRVQQVEAQQQLLIRSRILQLTVEQGSYRRLVSDVLWL